jgi:hypothetical protein
VNAGIKRFANIRAMNTQNVVPAKAGIQKEICNGQNGGTAGLRPGFRPCCQMIIYLDNLKRHVYPIEVDGINMALSD